ncbi:unnamed protein product, partial [Brachionus calyciflorus]
NLVTINLNLEKIGLKLSDSLILINQQFNNGLSGVLKLKKPESKVELNEILERDMQLKNGQKINFVNELFKKESTSNFNVYFQVVINNEKTHYFDPYTLLDQIITIILNLLDSNV